MAALYGRLRGNRGAVTRTGSRSIESTVETWQGIVRVHLTADGDYTVTTTDKHGNRRRTVVTGNVDRDEANCPIDA